MDGLAEQCTEDVVNIPFQGWPGDPIYNGHAGIKDLAGTWWDMFDGTHMKIERIVEDGERLVVFITHTGTRDGVQVEQKLGGILHFRDGLLSEARWILGFDETLAESGVE